MVWVGTGIERIYSARAFVPIFGIKIESKELIPLPLSKREDIALRVANILIW